MALIKGVRKLQEQTKSFKRDGTGPHGQGADPGDGEGICNESAKEPLDESTRGLRTMKRSQAQELEKQGHTVKVYDRRGLVVVDGKDQYKLVEEALEESLDYEMSERDKKVVQAFLDKKPYTGKALETDGTVVTTTGYVGGYSSTEPLAKWVAGPGSGERVLVSGEAFGHISQTWVNYVRRQVPKKLLFEGRERWKPIGRAAKPVVPEPVRVEEPVFHRELSNPKVSLAFSPTDVRINGTDKEDRNNWPCFFTTTKRNVAKAWKELEAGGFTQEMTMSAVEHFLQDRGIRTHHWCSMD